jgi:hypothetical protein
MKYIFMLVFLVVSCNPNSLIENAMDIMPPGIVSIEVISGNTLLITATESVEMDLKHFYSNKNLTIQGVNEGVKSLEIIFNETLKHDVEYTNEFKIYDRNGNYLAFISKIYGFNPYLPELVINEFTTRGSASNPDKLELLVLSDGNIGGVTIFNGIEYNYDNKFIFPSFYVKKGDYIVVSAASEKYPENKDNFYYIYSNDFNLSSNNGVISLYSNPYGKILDGIAYTSNLNDIEKNYRNFGTKKVMDRVDKLFELGFWLGNDVIFPEDCINIEKTTTTRSANRKKENYSKTKNDWYIVPTRGSTFGFINNEEVY